MSTPWATCLSAEKAVGGDRFRQTTHPSPVDSCLCLCVYEVSRKTLQMLSWPWVAESTAMIEEWVSCLAILASVL